jgi:hypothetical protein
MNEITLLAVSIIISIIAIIISIIALVKSNKHNLITVKPLLHWRYYSSSRRARGVFYIENNGFGPLLFKEFTMNYDGKTYKHMFDLKKQIDKKLELSDSDYVKKKNSNSLSLDSFSLKEGDRKNLIGFQLKDEAKEKYKQYIKEIKSIEFDFVYSDIYGNKNKGKFYFSNLHT